MNEPEKPGVIESQTYSLPVDDIDTDQIIPAEFLTTTTRDGLGERCFYYWRFDEDGSPIRNHPLNEYDPHRHQVLVTGTNFGCGSSREHAPWALLDLGVRAVISDRFADIFYNNALKNGLLPVTLDPEAVTFLHAHAHHPIRIDISERTAHIEGLGSYRFPLSPFAAHCLMEGIDQLEFLLRQEDEIRAFELGRMAHLA